MAPTQNLESCLLAGIFRYLCLETPANKRGSFSVLLVLTLCSNALFAAEDNARQIVERDAVVVTATRVPATQLNVPGAVDVIRIDQLRANLPLIDAAEVLNRAPGLNIQSRQNYAQDTQISIRGFGSRATFGIRGIKLYVDDIPATIPDGQGQGAIIPFFAVNGLEVLRGPWAVGYGNAAGGVIAASTRAAVNAPALEVRRVNGSDATMVTSAHVGSSASGELVNGYIAAQRLQSEGYRDHGRVRRDQAYARMDVALGNTTFLLLVGNRIDQPDTEDPLGLTRAQFDAAPRQATSVATQFNTRKSIRHQQAGAVLTSNMAGLDWKAIVYGGTRDVVQFLATPVGAQSVASSSGGVIDLQRRFQGVGLRAAQSGGSLTWTLGVDLDRADDQRQGFENFVSRAGGIELGVRGNLRRDELNTQRANDVFGMLNWTAADRTSLHLGLRRSDIRLSVDDRYVRVGNGDDSGQIRYASSSPTAGLLQRLNDTVSVYVSASRGFETPTAAELAYRPDQSSGLNVALQSSATRQWEAGVKHISTTLSLKFAAFEIRSKNEIVQSSSSGGRATFQNAAATRRRGAELSADWKPAPHWSAYLALTGIRAEVSEAYTAGVGAAARPISAGSAMPAVPRANLFAEVVWRAMGREENRQAAGLSIAADVNARSRMAADDANTTFAAGYAALGASIRYQMPLATSMLPSGTRGVIDVGLRGDNLTDTKYAGSVIVNDANQRFFEGAPGRRGSVNVAATIRF